MCGCDKDSEYECCNRIDDGTKGRPCNCPCHIRPSALRAGQEGKVPKSESQTSQPHSRGSGGDAPKCGSWVSGSLGCVLAKGHQPDDWHQDAAEYAWHGPWTPMPPPPRWRVGRSLGRTLYRGDELVGLVDHVDFATQIVEAMNARAALPAPMVGGPTPAPSTPSVPGTAIDYDLCTKCGERCDPPCWMPPPPTPVGEPGRCGTCGGKGKVPRDFPAMRCPDCDGRGYLTHLLSQPACFTCKGRGEVMKLNDGTKDGPLRWREPCPDCHGGTGQAAQQPGGGAR